jgi:hypothetical protein
LTKATIAILSLLALSACAGRSPNLPTIAYDTDSIQSCDALERQAVANAAEARSKIASNQSRDSGDIAIGVVSTLFFFPGLFALDTKNADGHEGNALLDRNERLKQIALGKGCDVSRYPTVARYE